MQPEFANSQHLRLSVSRKQSTCNSSIRKPRSQCCIASDWHVVIWAPFFWLHSKGNEEESYPFRGYPPKQDGHRCSNVLGHSELSPGPNISSPRPPKPPPCDATATTSAAPRGILVLWTTRAAVLLNELYRSAFFFARSAGSHAALVQVGSAQC